MNKYTILVIEDEKNILNFISAALTANEYKVLTASDGAKALMLATSYCPDLIILDLGLPDMDGVELIRKLRSWCLIPIIIVSARTHEADKVQALDLGADDYVTKPFGISELLARVRTALRHRRSLEMNESNLSGVFKSNSLLIDYDKRHVYMDDVDIHLTQNEYKIVALLSLHAGKVLTYDYLMKHIWGPNACNDNQILRVNMANIRRKMEQNPADPQYIYTEMGVGYRMVECDRE